MSTHLKSLRGGRELETTLREHLLCDVDTDLQMGIADARPPPADGGAHVGALDDVEFGLARAACRDSDQHAPPAPPAPAPAPPAPSPGADSSSRAGDDAPKEADAPQALPMWQRFLPALIFYPIWLRTMIANDMWSEAYSDGWPMAIAMIAGSLIAGSTPLGGGVVAFPVSVLVLKLSPQEGRDFACLIQSIGMVAAAFLISSCKAHLLHRELIVYTVVAGTWGVSCRH